MKFKNDHIDNLIGENSIFEGDFHVNGNLRVEGKFCGQLKVKDQLFVGEKGRVKTNVQARQVVIGGIFIGDIEAKEEVILLNTGKILGNIKTPTLQVDKGVISQGNIEITSNKYHGDAIKQIVEESFSDSPTISQEMENQKESKEDPKKSKVKNIIGKVFD